MVKKNTAPSVEDLQECPSIEATIQELDDRQGELEVSTAVVSELRRYLKTGNLIPKKVDVNNRKSVVFVQESLKVLAGRNDRASAVQEDVRGVLRVLDHVEHAIRQDLFEVGYLTGKDSKPVVESLLRLAVPELYDTRKLWTDLDLLCRAVQAQTSSALDILKVQMKLDDNNRWANRPK